MLEIFNDALSVMIVPQLGAKIVSLRNKDSGRQWCWHPGDFLELFRNDYLGFHDVAALEPTNAPTDFLGNIPSNNRSVLLPKNMRNWSVALEMNN
jgi:hypothetical protein